MEGSTTATRILAVCNIDLMANLIVRPWLTGLLDSGYEVHVACAPGPQVDELTKAGFQTHAVDIQRRFNPLTNLKAIFQVWQLIRQYKFQIINTHSPIAGVVGRIAALLAGAPKIVYTVHGFYFHENMPLRMRIPVTAVEWALGQITDCFMFVSDEDRQTALRTGIARNDFQTTTIYNAVNLQIFFPASASERLAAKCSLGFGCDHTVIGIVGRIVKEKGHREFAAMAESLLQTSGNFRFVIVGDSLASDRDQFGGKFREQVAARGMSDKFTFVGFTTDVAHFLRALDIFVLPSYREGFPKSILEAMATGLPVVTTNIRGCREAVVDGETGLIVPPGNAAALASAVLYLVEHPEIAKAMGHAGRRRAAEVFDSDMVHRRFVDIIDVLRSELVQAEAPYRNSTRFSECCRSISKRILDVAVSFAALAILSPLLLSLGLFVRLSMGSPVFFRQKRPGLHERPFTMLKFRTMRDAVDTSGRLLPDAERLARFGQFLRRSSLDELPEFWNVLKGDMSLVGPRPLLMQYLERYDDFQRQRHKVKPGISGYAQIHGRNGLNWDDKFRLDVWYVDHRSFSLDLKILWRTLAVVVRGGGIANEGHATMPEFGLETKSLNDSR